MDLPEKFEEEFKEQTHFVLNQEEWDRFQAVLNAPPKPTQGLIDLLRKPSVIELANE